MDNPLVTSDKQNNESVEPEEDHYEARLQLGQVLRNTNEGRRKLTAVETVCMLLGAMDIVLSFSIIISIVVEEKTDHARFTELLEPIEEDRRIEEDPPKATHLPFTIGEAFVLLFKVMTVGLINCWHHKYLAITNAVILLVMSILMIFGVLRKIWCMLIGFIIYAAVTFLICFLFFGYVLLINTLHYGLDDLYLIYYFGAFIYSVFLAVELVIVCLSLHRLRKMDRNPTGTEPINCETL